MVSTLVKCKSNALPHLVQVLLLGYLTPLRNYLVEHESYIPRLHSKRLFEFSPALPSHLLAR